MDNNNAKKNMSPFFSILIPTKNRSHLIADAINSVLGQTLQDFEIIIVDNDDTGSTYDVVKGFFDDRVIYQRTGALSMDENWEVGSELSSGKYMTVLEDKLTYYPYALECIHNVIESVDSDVVVWGISSFSNELDTRDMSGVRIDCREIKSDELLACYVGGVDVWRSLPRIINSAISRNLINKIKNSSKSKTFFNYTSPDLVAAFSQLALVEEISVISNNLEFYRSNLSNATNVRVNKKKAEEYFSGKSKYSLYDAVSLVPIKNISLVHNTVYNDFLRVRQLYGGRLNNYVMCDFVYSRICLKDTISTLFRGGGIASELMDVSRFMFKQLSFMSQITLWFWWWKTITRKSMSKYIFRPIRRSIKRVSLHLYEN